MGFNSGFKGLMKREYSRQIFEKYSNVIKILQWERSCSIADAQTNRHDEDNIWFLQFCERA